MRFILFVILLTTAACAGTNRVDPHAAGVDSSLQNLGPTIDAIVREEMEATHQPGVAVVIVQNGKTVMKRGYGVTDFTTNQSVDTEKTLFRIGSVTKALTALALTRLIDDKRVGLDDDVTTYFDEITNLSGSNKPVTVENLITHTGGFDQIGLGRHVNYFNRSLDDRKGMRLSLAAFLGDNNLRRVTPPGELFRYDTYGISLAGLVLGRATGLSYAEAMHQEMFEPLGMTRSFVEADDAHFSDLAIGHGWVDSTYVAQPYEIYMTTPASSIDATPADMARLLEALTGGGANAHGRLFSEETAAAVLAPQYRPHPDFTGITHGLWESPSVNPPDGPGVHSVGHGGSMLGYWTLFEIFTEKNIGVFIATNRNFEAGGGPVNLGTRINNAVLNAVYGTPPAIQVAPAVPLAGRDLSDYVGDYANGTFCKSCTQQEFARGAWSARNTRTVEKTEAGLLVNGDVFLPTADADVFVRETGGRELFFGRNAAGAVSFYSSSYGPATFERVPAMRELREGLDKAAQFIMDGQLDQAKVAITSALDTSLDSGLYFEHSINALGYQYLQNEQTDMAILVFQFNAQSFPESWNVHDSYGEALAVAGRYKEAIAAYERSVTLNPDSESGVAALASLRTR
ncbi:MAG: serine hydrolase [Rhodothermales bacterium]